MAASPRLQVVIPVFNEVESIEETLRELLREFSSRLSVQFIVCEDGSTDGTRDLLDRLSHELPLKAITSVSRKGYSRAVLDGWRISEAPFVLCLDGDGQCNPTDFWRFWELRERYDIVIGWRVRRPEPWFRRALSRGFKFLYGRLFRVRIHDPSCPFLLFKREVIETLRPKIGTFPDGLWWEVMARAAVAGFSIHELPISYRERRAGQTRVYTLGRLPAIGWHHTVGLFRLWKELARS